MGGGGDEVRQVVGVVERDLLADLTGCLSFPLAQKPLLPKVPQVVAGFLPEPHEEVEGAVEDIRVACDVFGHGGQGRYPRDLGWGPGAQGDSNTAKGRDGNISCNIMLLYVNYVNNLPWEHSVMI